MKKAGGGLEMLGKRRKMKKEKTFLTKKTE
jgi:hypothetical protein